MAIRENRGESIAKLKKHVPFSSSSPKSHKINIGYIEIASLSRPTNPCQNKN